MDHDHEIDITGLCCAMPVIKISKELKDMKSGDVLLAVSDKISMKNDIPAFCRQTGNELLDLAEKGDTLAFYIKKG